MRQAPPATVMHPSAKAYTSSRADDIAESDLLDTNAFEATTHRGCDCCVPTASES